ncbi:MAG: VWA domain-containing protein [Spirochaetes bacterium]|nr:VWA domain-containing protein [Spirochaetota bacterium]
MKTIKYYIFIILLIFLCNAFIHTDGFIVIQDPVISPTPFPLEVKNHRVKVDLNDQIAATNIDQIFYNPTSSRLEGEYIFPIPKNAIIKKFTMYINGKETPAELIDAEKARKIYEDIVRKQKDPALLEYNNLNMYRVRIFPIEPRSEKRIIINYNEVLNKDNGTFEYLYPLNTEKFSSKSLQDVSVVINLKTNDNIKNIICTSHDAEIVYKNEKNAVISYERQNIKPDIDFKLYYSTANSQFGLSLITYKESDNDKFFLMNISPGYFVKQNELVKKDVTFVLDTSGSMAGEKIEQAKKALLYCITNLNKDDRFEIIRFSTEAEALFGSLETTGDNALNKAKKFINNFNAIGGTNIEEALNLAIANSGKSNNHIIIFITDGKPTIGETEEDKLIQKIQKSNTLKTRIFTFGIGEELNIHLLDKITKETKAYSSYISPSENIEVKISSFYQKIQYPVLTDIKINFSKNINVYNVYPKEFPDLFVGSSLTLSGKYKGEGNTKVILEGMLKNAAKTIDFNIDFLDRSNDEFISVIWASRRIGYLLDQIRLKGENKELIGEVVFLAKKHGIVTPYTSYLILEDEMVRTARGELDRENQILNNIVQETEIPKVSKKDYDSMKEKSGQKSIQASEEFRSLNDATNLAQTKQGYERMQYQDKKGNSVNITQQIKNIQGRAFYQNNNLWVDSKIDQIKNKKINKIKFSSREYYELLKKYPGTAEILSLSKNIKFIFNNEVYEIFE